MSNQEFENYIALIGKLLQLSSEQREKISGELQDHLQMRIADLMSEGSSQHEATTQALEEFGDAAVMAKNFQSVINLKRRRWMMRFATLSIAAMFLATVLTMALWPDNARFGTPNLSIAQSSNQEKTEADEKPSGPKLSPGTMRELLAEEKLKEAVDLNFEETPFSEIEEELEVRLGLNFVLTDSAMDDALTEDEPITVNLSGIPLNRGLKIMLEPKNATYVIDSGVIMIISLDDAQDVKWFRLKMYDCKDLVKVLPETHSSHGGGGFGGGFGGAGGGGFGGGGGGGVFAIQGLSPGQQPTPKSQTSNNQPNQSALLDQKLNRLLEITKAEAAKNRPKPSSDNTLIDLVTSMVSPDSWERKGQGLGQIKIVNGILVVYQTEEVHGKIDSLLTDLKVNILGNGMPDISAILKAKQMQASKSRPQRKPEDVSEDLDPFGNQTARKKQTASSDDPFK